MQPAGRRGFVRGFTQHQTQAALLGVDAEDVEDFLLVGQQREGFRVERIALQAEVGADHKIKFQLPVDGAVYDRWPRD